MQLLPITAAVTALGFVALAGLCLRHSERRSLVWALAGACVATAAWAIDFGATGALGGEVVGPRQAAFELVRSLGWFVFLVLAFREASGSTHSDRVFVTAAGMAGFVAVLTYLAAVYRPPPTEVLSLTVLEPYGHLALTIGSLVLLEPLLRHARGEGSRRMPILVVGVGGLLVYDLFVWSEALLFRRLDPALVEAGVLVNLVALPVIGAGVARNSVLSMDLNLARKAVIDSATLTAVGGYLLLLALVGGLLRESAGDWGRLLQVGILFGGGVALAIAWFSPWLRSRLRFQLGRYLFTHRHDYRDQWRDFAEALSAPAFVLHEEALLALADVLGARRGGLWLRERDDLVSRSAWSLPPEAEKEPLSRDFRAWLEDCGAAPRLLDAPVGLLPEWLGTAGEPWAVVPLVRRGVVGVVLLGATRDGATLHREDAELLEIAASHVTSALLADDRARRSAEARRFEELSRGMSFIAHDLRNVANELTLTLANARKHIEKPDFQRDLLLSMEDSVSSMQRLLDKVAERRAAAASNDATDLGEAARNAVSKRAGSATTIEFRAPGRGPFRVGCDFDRAASACGHLIQNAIDAAGPSGHVEVRLGREGGSALLEVCDDGPGMDERRLADRLRHPFQSDKAGGFGIGLFECREFARELGGELAFETAPGAGTTARLLLPLQATNQSPDDSEQRDVDA